MSAWRAQNNSHPKGRVPGYYARNRIYPDSYAQPETQTRISRRIHDGFMLTNNYGLDTTSDDINSSPYSSPYYINGRYNSDNLTTETVSLLKKHPSICCWTITTARRLTLTILPFRLISKCGRESRFALKCHTRRRLLEIQSR